MPWDDFAKTRNICCPEGFAYEAEDHELEIAGTPASPTIICRTDGCAVSYSDTTFQNEQLTGTVGVGDDESGPFTITYDPDKKQIYCQIGDSIPGTTGSWTADDPGPGDGGRGAS